MVFDPTDLLPVANIPSPYAQALNQVIGNSDWDKVIEFNLPEVINHLQDTKSPKAFGEKIVALFKTWRQENPPKTAAIIASALDYFNVDGESPLLKATMLAGFLADIPHPNPYHNNHHFHEVLIMLIILINHHNTAFGKEIIRLGGREISLLLIAACIHDFAHDGQSNIVEGTHFPSRLEKRSFDMAKPFLQSAGVDDTSLLWLEIMIICTDVSRGPNGRSPAGLCRDVFLAHEYDNIHAVNIPEFYQPLMNNPQLSLIATLLCEADIAPSSALTYDFSKMLTCLVAQESSVLKPSANTLHGFMEVICHGGFLTRASKSLLGANFHHIQKSAAQDKDDNVLYA